MWGFPCTTAAQIADADHQAPQGVITEKPPVIKPDAELSHHPVKTGGDKQKRGYCNIAWPSLRSADNKWQKILFEFLKKRTHLLRLWPFPPISPPD